MKQHEERCNMKRVQREKCNTEKCNPKRIQPEKCATRKKKHGKSATLKECHTEKVQYEKSIT